MNHQTFSEWKLYLSLFYQEEEDEESNDGVYDNGGKS